MRHKPLLALLALALCLGCAREDRVAISGKVTLDGQPVEAGSISFVPIDGTQSPTAGAEIVDGDYEVAAAQGPRAGAFRVEIRSQRKTGRKIPVGSPAPPGTMADETVEAIPKQYNKQSKLRADLKQGNNPLDFTLTSK
jgi:hypothetical protein